MEDAPSVLKDSKGERTPEAKNKSESLHLHSFQQLILVANFIILPFLLLFQLNLLENALLSLQYGLH